jgi:hypothetical protein
MSVCWQSDSIVVQATLCRFAGIRAWGRQEVQGIKYGDFGHAFFTLSPSILLSARRPGAFTRRPRLHSSDTSHTIYGLGGL